MTGNVCVMQRRQSSRTFLKDKAAPSHGLAPEGVTRNQRI